MVLKLVSEEAKTLTCMRWMINYLTVFACIASYNRSITTIVYSVII